jgi:O-antigen/teichoic acid export membrane protein
MAEAGAIGRLKQFFAPGRVSGGTALKEAAALGVARYFEQALMLLTPMLLVRVIDPAAFGEYRLFWLIGTTMALVSPLGIPSSLLYFFPRLDDAGRARFLGQGIIFIGATTLIWAAIFLALAKVLPAGVVQLLRTHSATVAIFVICWTVGSLLDVLPTAMRQVFWQAKMTIAISALRAILFLGVAFTTRNIDDILLVVAGFAVFKLVTLLWFIRQRCPLPLFAIERRDFVQQIAYSATFGLAALLATIRRQAEQWIAASVFSVSRFGAFSLALSLLIPFDVLRGVLATLILPKISQVQFVSSDMAALELNRRANVIAAFVILPGVAYLFAFSTDVVRLLFTEKYLIAVPVLQIYLVQAAILLEYTSLLNVYKLGAFQRTYTIVLLPLSVVASYLGAIWLGMPGAALGSLLTQVIATGIVFRKMSVLLSQPISRLQDWPALLEIAALSAGSSGLAYFVVSQTTAPAGMRCALGALLCSATYLGVTTLSGRIRTVTDLLGITLPLRFLRIRR